jgi:hypothetical protein
MRVIQVLMFHCLLAVFCTNLMAQRGKAPKAPPHVSPAITEREVRDVLRDFAKDSVAANREAMAAYYPFDGYITIGQGQKRLFPMRTQNGVI